MRFPAGLDGVIIPSEGHELLGGFYLAAGEGPRPTAILLHGVPGVEKNLDIAYSLRDQGWNCLYFHFRGSWGSGGRYTFAGQAADVHAAADWLEQQPSVNPERLALVGNSMGGYTAFAAAADDPRFQSLVAISPLADPALWPLPEELAAEFAAMLHGVSGQELQEQWALLPPVASMKEALTGRRILLINAEEDELFAPHHYRSVVEALPWMERRQLSGADHSFSTCRTLLVESVVAWLRQLV